MKPSGKSVIYAVITLCIILLSNTLVAGQEEQSTKETSLTFAKDIYPIMKKHCLKCHAKKFFAWGKLRLDSLDNIMKGGRSGKVLIPGAPEKSRLVQSIRSGQMPPPGQARMNTEEIEMIIQWIKEGGN